MSVFVFVCLSLCLTVCLSVFWHVCVSLHLLFRMSFMYIKLTACLPISLHVYNMVYNMSVCPFFYLSVCLLYHPPSTFQLSQSICSPVCWSICLFVEWFSWIDSLFAFSCLFIDPSFCLPFCLSVSTFVCLPITLLDCLFVLFSVCLVCLFYLSSPRLSVCPSLFLTAWLPVWLHVSLSALFVYHLPVCLFVLLSVCLSVFSICLIKNLSSLWLPVWLHVSMPVYLLH